MSYRWLAWYKWNIYYQILRFEITKSMCHKPTHLATLHAFLFPILLTNFNLRVSKWFFFNFYNFKVNNKIIFSNPKFKKINKNLELKKYIVIEILILIYKLYNCHKQYTILIFKSGQPPKPLKQNLKVKIMSLDKVS